MRFPVCNRRRLQFSLLSLVILMLAASVAFVGIGREVRHRQALQRLHDLGGHVSYGSKARFVHLWRHDDGAGFYFDYVSDEKAAIRCLRQLKPFTHIILLSNQQHLEPALRRAFPHAIIERGTAGII